MHVVHDSPEACAVGIAFGGKAAAALGGRALRVGLLASGVGLLAWLGCSPAAEVAEAPAPLRVIAHRGAGGLAPENTLSALDRARELGVREVEVDARMSRDGVVVLFHDRMLGKKTPLRGAVSAHDWAELKEAEIGSWFHRTHPRVPPDFPEARIASLDEALARHGDHFVWHIELKGSEEALPGAVLAAIDRAGVRDRAGVSSFIVPQLLEMRERAPDLPLCLIVPRDRERASQEGRARKRLSPDEGVDRAIAEGFAVVALALRDLTRERVERAHANGVSVRVFEVRSDADLEAVTALGVDAATVTYPDRALAFLARRPETPPAPPHGN